MTIIFHFIWTFYKLKDYLKKMPRLEDKAKDILYFIVANKFNEKTTITLACEAKAYNTIVHSYTPSYFSVP